MNAHASWDAVSDPQSRRQEFVRTLDVSGAGSVLLQTAISKVVQLISNDAFGIQGSLPRRSWTGNAFYSNRRTAATTGADWVADTEEPVTSEGSYSQATFTFRTLLGRVTITRKLVATGRSYGDVVATELTGKAEDMARTFESACAIGDSAADANQIDGLLTLIGNVSGQTIANTTVDAGDAISLVKLDETIDSVKGLASNPGRGRIYASRAGSRKLNAVLQSQQRFNDKITIAGGFRVNSYDGIPIVKSTGIPDTLTWDASETRITVFSGAATTALIVVDTNYVFFAELTPMTVMPLARTTSQNQKVDMFMDIALVLDNTRGGAILAGVLP